MQDWGFFVPYLLGSISLIVLAIGSISPGYLSSLCQFLFFVFCSFLFSFLNGEEMQGDSLYQNSYLFVI